MLKRFGQTEPLRQRTFVAQPKPDHRWETKSQNFGGQLMTTSQGSWIADIQVLKPCRAMRKNSYLNYFLAGRIMTGPISVL